MTTAPAAGPGSDHVILMHPDGRVRGLAPRATVHDADTPLHLAFSCHLRRADGHLLLTRRALGKRTWPGVWTNAFCGHPRQGESMVEAITRHAEHELGMRVRAIREVLPDFRYRAVDASGVVENEICPVFVAEAAGEPVPHPDEVMDLRWVPPTALEAVVEHAPWLVSPWLAEQHPRLRTHLAAGTAPGRAEEPR